MGADLPELQQKKFIPVILIQNGKGDIFLSCISFEADRIYLKQVR